MKTAVEASYTLVVPDANTLSDVMGINAFSPSGSSNRSVLASPLYRTYCSLYEECKCIGMKVSISVASQIGGTALPSLQIYTAWDRRHGSGEALYTSQEIKNSSTYNVATALNNNVAKLTRSLYASDLMEKAQWHDCSVSVSGGSYQDDAYTAAGVNPNFFCPCLFVCFGSPNLAQAQSPATVACSISTVYYFAFRNPKFGAGAASSKLVDLGAATVETKGTGPDEGDGDMDLDANLEWNPDLDSNPGSDVSSGLSEHRAARRIREAAAEADVSPAYRQAITEVFDETTRDIGSREQISRQKALRADLNNARRKKTA